MCAREQLTPYKDRTRLFQKGEVFPGVTAIPCHGHTPGHTSSRRSCVGWSTMQCVPIKRACRGFSFLREPSSASVG
jgi:hypothetical protein